MRIEVCIIRGPKKPLIDNQINRARHGLALRILGNLAFDYEIGQGKGRRKAIITQARLTNEFWKIHEVALKAAGFECIWPDEDEGVTRGLARLAKIASAVAGSIPDRKPS